MPVPKSALLGPHGQWNCTEEECDYFVALAEAGASFFMPFFGRVCNVCVS